MTAATEIFFKRVDEHADGQPAEVTAETTLREIVGLMATSKFTAVVVVDAERRPVGIITEQDIVRRVAFNADPDQSAPDIMTAPVHTIGAWERLFIAIARMRRLGHRHLPVVDGQGRLSGILDLHDTMVHAAGSLIDEIEELTQDDSIDGLTEIKAAQVDVADQMLRDGVSASEIQTLLSHVNNDIYRRLTDLNLAALAAEGSEPPVGFTLIIMGSGGRSENYIYPDQDFGFIVADYPDERHTEIDQWFIDLAARVSNDLDKVGLPYCTGNVMATNPLWRKNLSQWKGQIDYWNRRANVTALISCDIFFDFQASWGDPSLASELRSYVTKVTKGNEPFMRALFTADRDHGTARRWFGRFATERKDEDHKGEVNLKLYGTLPLIEGVRLLALREGVEVTGTLARLESLLERNVATRDEFDDLTSAYKTISDLLLRNQIGDFKAGRKVSGFVHPKKLSRWQKRRLREAFKAVEGLRQRINYEFGGEIF